MSKNYDERINDLKCGVKLLKISIKDSLDNDESVPMSWLEAVEDMEDKIKRLEELKSEAKPDHLKPIYVYC